MGDVVSILPASFTFPALDTHFKFGPPGRLGQIICFIQPHCELKPWPPWWEVSVLSTGRCRFEKCFPSLCMETCTLCAANMETCTLCAANMETCTLCADCYTNLVNDILFLALLSVKCQSSGEAILKCSARREEGVGLGTATIVVLADTGCMQAVVVALHPKGERSSIKAWRLVIFF